MKKNKYLDAKKYVTKEFKHLKKLPRTYYYGMEITSNGINRIVTAKTIINGEIIPEGSMFNWSNSLAEAIINTSQMVNKILTQNDKVWLRKPAKLKMHNGKYAIRIRLSY